MNKPDQGRPQWRPRREPTHLSADDPLLMVVRIPRWLRVIGWTLAFALLLAALIALARL